MTEASHYARHPGPPSLRFRYAAFGKRGENCIVHMWIWSGPELLAAGFVAWLNPGEHYESASGVKSELETGRMFCARPSEAWGLSALLVAAGVTYDDLISEPGNAETIAAARAFFEGPGGAL